MARPTSTAIPSASTVVGDDDSIAGDDAVSDDDDDAAPDSPTPQPVQSRSSAVVPAVVSLYLPLLV